MILAKDSHVINKSKHTCARGFISPRNRGINYLGAFGCAAIVAFDSWICHHHHGFLSGKLLVLQQHQVYTVDSAKNRIFIGLLKIDFYKV